MPRPACSYLRYLRTRSHGAGSARLVIILVIALVAAPAWSALRNECGLCPPTCPMHQPHAGTQETHASHLGCHGSTASAGHHDRRAAHDHLPSVACATCGHHSQPPGTVLPPMILPTAHAQSVLLVVERAPRVSIAPHHRLTEPPDTPPPIVAA